MDEGEAANDLDDMIAVYNKDDPASAVDAPPASAEAQGSGPETSTAANAPAGRRRIIAVQDEESDAEAPAPRDEDASAAASSHAGGEEEDEEERGDSGKDDGEVDADGDDRDYGAHSVDEDNANEDGPAAKKKKNKAKRVVSDSEDDSEDSDAQPRKKKSDGKKRKKRASSKEGKSPKRRKRETETAPKEEDLHPVDIVSKQIRANKHSRGVEVMYANEDEKNTVAIGLLESMQVAFETDHKKIKERVPAMEKLKLVDEVCKRCSEKALQPALKANDVGSKLFDWLRPIGAKSTLPNLTMRTKLYELISKIPFDEDDLVKNRLGKLLNLLANHKDETPENKRLLSSILRKWQQMAFAN